MMFKSYNPEQLIALLCFVLLPIFGFAQTGAIKGVLLDTADEPVIFSNVAIYAAADSSLVKVETSDEHGVFVVKNLPAGKYFLVATFVGLEDIRKDNLVLSEGQTIDLKMIRFNPSAVELSEATVSAERVMVEVKADRTIFNVEGTVNSAGADGITLLRQAPGVMVDNNDNISVLGRSGVLIYVDGKRLPLSGEEIAGYLRNLPAEQIDRIEIITSPGAKYEAEGNAGIIDIRLKKDKNMGANGTVGGNVSKGRLARYKLNASGNYRNKLMNVFGSAGFEDSKNYHDMLFYSKQNGLVLDEINNTENTWQSVNYRIGTDFFIGKKHTVGFLVNGTHMDGTRYTENRIAIGRDTDPVEVDSILQAVNNEDYQKPNRVLNLNYRFSNTKERSLNVDLDYGTYENRNERYQPNRYYDAQEQALISENIYAFDTPTKIDIYTFKLDYEDAFLGGTIGLGSKLSRVNSDNTFLFFNVLNGNAVRNDTTSNLFYYDEKVYAGYVNYARSLNKKWSMSAGLRAEQTDAVGDLVVFLPELQEDPVKLNYLRWFPSAGLTWQVARQHALALNYSRRINRPDYNVLNPFNNQTSELSFGKGNPNLQPEFVNNIELGYTLSYRYNFKLAYSKTHDQITRFIAPDTTDARAGAFSWDNLATKTVISFNASAPIQFKKWWSAYINFNASHINNQGDDVNAVDLQAFSYNFYQQHTFSLPANFKGEVSGYYSGPGIWGAVFKFRPSWSLNLGLQRKFFDDRLNVKLSVNDIFYESGWEGISEFAGLVSEGSGNWDSRRVSLSLSYSFGNENVKSRKRKTGLTEEADRVGGE